MSLQLTLTTASLHNVVIANEADTIYFDIITPEWETHLTTVRRLNTITRSFDVVGNIRNLGDKLDQPIAVSVYGREFVPADDFLQRVGGSASGISQWRFLDGEGGSYAWSAPTHHQVELFNVSDGMDAGRSPVAVFHPHKRYLRVGMISHHAHLEVDPSIMDSLDMVIVSLLVFERRHRAGSL
ncbi:hypothetical protein BJ138DRAFT_1125679 [Hygrophoropsis aurantiaca]|uniref:Uncharacterized protein n=1 Tax=Hygrophoropsis aurantiaca TaxID=72124 RepID=A0ACB8AEZ6_9AGAM|nr:hypothetical protein BJ138DRAFT_1125679 [Hygrophoropsis aurantiaca]